MIRIGDFSRLSRISIRMLRHYDEIGLLKPVQTDPDSGYRYYSEGQLLIAGRIAAFRDMGFSLSSILLLLSSDGDKPTLEHHLLLKRTELLEEHRQLSERLQLLDTALKRLRKDNTMKYDVTLKTFPERYAATVRMQIPAYHQEGLLWNTLQQETKSLNLVPDVPCYCYAVFHDREFKETDVDVEVQQTVKGSYPDTEHVIFRTLPKVTVASACYKGSYEQTGDVMAAVAQWIADNRYMLNGPSFYIYHVSPHETDNPDEFVTEVCFPVVKL